VVSLKSAKQAVATARESIDTSARLSICALAGALLGLIFSLMALMRVKRAFGRP
jgi:uncharacterized membrane protein YgaE (UPF0421/DUF939 family)